jgi:hypothetical protein
VIPTTQRFHQKDYPQKDYPQKDYPQKIARIEQSFLKPLNGVIDCPARGKFVGIPAAVSAANALPGM